MKLAPYSVREVRAREASKGDEGEGKMELVGATNEYTTGSDTKVNVAEEAEDDNKDEANDVRFQFNNTSSLLLPDT